MAIYLLVGPADRTPNSPGGGKQLPGPIVSPGPPASSRSPIPEAWASAKDSSSHYAAVKASVLPAAVKDLFASREILNDYLKFLGILLRLWTIVGELFLTSIAYALDYKG